MVDLAPLFDLVGAVLPFSTFEPLFMRQALVGLLLLAPMAATMGVQVVNFRMAFFSDAVSHSAFAGVALGILLAVDPHWSTALFGVAVGLGIVALLRSSTLASDTATGVFFSAVVAFGLLVVSRERGVARDMQRFLYGDILTISDAQIVGMLFLFAAIALFQTFAFNRLLYIGVSPALAKAHRVQVGLCQYVYAALLSLVVAFAVWAVGVLLVTALLVVPAAAARNIARSAGAMFWWSNAVGGFSAVVGLMISAQPWAETATGATVVGVACVLFLVSLGIRAVSKGVG